PANPYASPGSWPAFEQPASRNPYEVRAGWAVADDSEPVTGPTPATGVPTAPHRAVSAYDDVLSAPAPSQSPFTAGAYETGDITSSPAAAAWPAPPPAPGAAAPGAQPVYSPQPETQGTERRGRRRTPEQDPPHDYYR
ncbi:hypothetical protein C1J01_40605, partial [Nonomuraea aridisoli]